MVEAPDILYNETSNDTIVLEGAGTKLRCEARGYPEPTVMWRRENGALIALRKNQKVERGKKEGGDNFKCHVSALISNSFQFHLGSVFIVPRHPRIGHLGGGW